MAQRPLFDPDRMAAKEDPNLAPRSMTVTQLNSMVKRVLGAGLPATIHLTGQVSNISRPASGHLYFTLKDDRSEVRAVMWRSAAAAVKFKMEDGLEVVATGSVDVYEVRGQYQFNVRKLEPKGVGNLELAFRQLYERLSKEGLFDAARKKKIPAYPRRIGVVTSSSGAAIHDILHTLQRRFSCVEVLLHPVRVQGEGAALEIAGAIRRLNQQSAALGGIDVLIVGRGGGSLEDLWAFNEEVVARAVHASRIPIISGVGHEVDVTICDLVADLRAPTPTAAAELAVPLRSDVLEYLAGCESRLRRCMRHHLDLQTSRLDGLQRAEIFRSPQSIVRRSEQQVDELIARLSHAVRHGLGQAQARLARLHIRLAGIRPAVVLRDQQARLARADHLLRAAVQRQLWQAERRIGMVAGMLRAASPATSLAREAERLKHYQARLSRAADHKLALSRSRLEGLANQLEVTGYRRTLARGFSLTWNQQRDKIVRRPEDVASGHIIVTQTAEGDFRSRVESNDDAGARRRGDAAAQEQSD